MDQVVCNFLLKVGENLDAFSEVSRSNVEAVLEGEGGYLAKGLKY